MALPGARGVKVNLREAPAPVAPRPAGHAILTAGLSSEPFAPAQHEAQRKVERTQAALPKQPTPNLPRLPNPTPAQAHAALGIALASQRHALGTNPGPAKLQRYRDELRADPRQREYLRTLEHYARSLNPTGSTREPLREAKPLVPVVHHQGVLGGLATILGSALPSIAGPALKPLQETGVRKGVALTSALVQHPVGTTRSTLTSIPETLNAMLTGTARLGAEATVEGKPGAAVEQFAKALTSDINRRYGGLSKPGGVEADAARISKEGALPELLDASLLLGGPATVAGKAISKGVEATGYGAKELAALQRLQEGTRQVLQAQHPAEALQRPLRGAERRRAFVAQAASGKRPNLRSAPGREAPSPVEGAAVKPQKASSNFFRAAGQTALDDARRARTMKGLRAIQQVRAQIEHNPNLAGFLPEPKPHIQPLALDQRLGEVLPLMQKGGQSSRFPGLGFLGAAKQQRVGTSALKTSAVEQRRAEANVLQQHFEKLLKGATPEQRALLVHAKEGTLPLHDPQLAHGALKEIHQQALEGSRDAQGRSLIPMMDRRRGSDVAAQTGRVLAHIDKHGAESVFNPHFEELVHALPDERLTAARDPSLSQDALTSRRYRPQVQHLERWAARHPHDPLASQTRRMTAQIKHLETEGGDLRAGRPNAELVKGADARVAQAKRDLLRAQKGEAHAEGRREVRGPHEMLNPSKLRGDVVKARQALKDAQAAAADARRSHVSPEHRHMAAADKYATAKNLADELAKMHGLPTDRAYVEHTKRFTDGNLVHTVGNSAPRVARQMEGQLAAKGYRSTDARLIVNGMLKNIRNDYKVKFLKPWHDRFNVAPEGLTAHQAQEWLIASGRDPAQFAVAHLGKLRSSIAEDLNMEHAPHFNLDAAAHAQHHGNLLDQALGGNIPRSDTTKGAGVYPVAALNELKGVFSSPALPGRLLGKAKSTLSSLMLGTSLPWLTTMSGVTYPVQSLYGGAGPIALREAHSWYRAMPLGDKRTIDRWFGIDTPFELGTHGITSERIGSTAPKGFAELASVMRAAKDFPLVKQLAANRPDHLILRMERVPRRYARINVAYKGVKTQALREMLKASHGAAAEQSKLQLALARMEHFGRKPAQEWIDAAMANQKFIEAHAQHLDNVLGEWKKLTQFERNIVSRGVLFYPWLRYSVKLAAKTLPRDHPLSYALALKYGAIQHEYLKELLGTDPTIGNVYLGPEQPGVAPEKRKFSVVGMRAANPLLNTVADLLGAESPSQVLGVLPPYFSDLIEYAAGKNLFTDKPLKGADQGEPEYRPGHRPDLLRFGLNRALATLNPGRTAQKVAGGGAPQSDESLLGDKPVQYSPRTLNRIKREHAELGTTPGQALLHEVLPILPHPDEGKLAGKIRAEERKAKEQQHKERKAHVGARASGATSAADEALALRREARTSRSSPAADAALQIRRELQAARR